MDTEDVQTLVEELGTNIDDLEASLAPLLKTALATTAARAPLLDKAKLYVLATYAIESILFSYLRLNGVDAKEHAVFQELTRVKEYFGKIKTAENGPEKPPTTIDKDAAARFIKAGLAGNDGYDRDRRTKELGASKRKADEVAETARWGTQNRFEGAAKRMRAEETIIPGLTVQPADVEEDNDSMVASTKSQAELKAEKKAAKHQRRMEKRLAKQSPSSSVDNGQDDGITYNATTARGVHDPKDAAGEHHEQRAKKKSRKTRSEIRQDLEDKRAREMM